MIRHLIVLCSILVLSGAAVLAADTPTPTIVPTAQIQWKPGTGPLAGTQVAQIFGDPSKPSTFVTRIRFPDGHKVRPHFHDVEENVTVLQGTLMFGVGNTVDPSKMVALPAGSFFSLPAKTPHYAMAKGVTVIQLNDVGPWAMHPVSP
jgi:quercetin dioxygenase-like cupin family protein